MDDEALLQEFTRTRSEKALRQLVDRYLPLVMGVALRRTGNRQLAEEIAQDVFAVFARRAGHLNAGSGLAGWLHRTAVNRANSAVRSEARHHRKLKALNEARKDHLDIMEHELPNDVLPVLDEALNQLSRSDKDLILMRYFEGRSVREIAPVINLSESASQKRMQRALAKLSAILKRKGVVTPVAALSAGLLSSLSKSTASAALARSITEGAIASASSLPTKTILANIFLQMSTYKTAVGVGLLVLLAVPLAIQRNEISKRKLSLSHGQRELNSLRKSATKSHLLAARSAAGDWRKKLDTNNGVTRLDPYVFFEEVKRSHKSLTGQVSLERKLKSFDAEELKELTAATLRSTLTESEKKEVLPMLIDELIGLEPDRASKWAVDLIDGRENNEYPVMFGTLRHAIKGWMKDDPDAALSWLRQQTDSGAFDFKSLDGTSAADVAWGGAVAGLMVTDREAAIEIFHALGKRAGEEALNQIAWGDGFDVVDQELFVDLARSLPSRGSEARVLTSYARQLARNRSFDEAAEFVGAQNHMREVDKANLMLASAQLFSQATAPELQKRIEWLAAESPPKYAGNHIGQLLGSLSMNGHHGMAVESLEMIADQSIRDQAVAELLTSVDWKKGREELAALAESIVDDKLRAKAMERESSN